jgi:hypothetical protein
LSGGFGFYSYVSNTNGWVDILGLQSRNERGQYTRETDTPQRYSRSSEYPHSYRAGVQESVYGPRTVKDQNGNPILDQDGYRSFSDRDGNIISERDATIEHTTSVVDHWNSGGNNMTREERNNWYNEIDNLDILTREQNGREGAEMDDMIQEVGDNYTSSCGE